MSGSPDRGEKGDAGRDDMDEFADMGLVNEKIDPDSALYRFTYVCD